MADQVDPQLSLSWDDYNTNFSAGIENCFKHGDFVDCALLAEGQSIAAHRLVLSICSPYFQELFAQESTNKDVLVRVNVPYAALVNLLQFMYCGEVNLNEADLPTFLSAAETLQIKGLSDSSCKNEPQSSFDMATTSSQFDNNDNECIDGQQTKENEAQANVIPRTDKRTHEQSILHTIAPKRMKVRHSTDTDARLPPQYQSGKATVVSNSFGELDALVLPKETLSFDEYTKMDMYDENAARLISDEGQQLFLESILNEEVLEAMENWNEEDLADTDVDYTEEETFAENQNFLNQNTNDFKCQYCVYIAPQKSTLNRHIKEQHTHKDERPFKCSKCSYAAKRKSDLTKHEKSCKK